MITPEGYKAVPRMSTLRKAIIDRKLVRCANTARWQLLRSRRIDSCGPMTNEDCAVFYAVAARTKRDGYFDAEYMDNLNA